MCQLKNTTNIADHKLQSSATCWLKLVLLSRPATGSDAHQSSICPSYLYWVDTVLICLQPRHTHTHTAKYWLYRFDRFRWADFDQNNSPPEWCREAHDFAHPIPAGKYWKEPLLIRWPIFEDALISSATGWSLAYFFSIDGLVLERFVHKLCGSYHLVFFLDRQ